MTRIFWPLIPLLLAVVFPATATEYLDENFNPVSKDKATLQYEKTYLKNGLWQADLYYKDSEQLSLHVGLTEQNFNNAKYRGAFVGYYPNGRLEARGYFDEQNKLDGVYEHWDKDGSATVTSYQHGTIHGVRSQYHDYDPNSKVPDCTAFNAAQPQPGCIDRTHQRGPLASTIEYVNNQWTGLYRTYIADGTLITETHYKDGKRDGMAKHFNRDGILTSVTPYKNDKVDGEQIFYHENGQKSQSTHYRQGKYNGISHRWNDKGELTLQREYKNSKLDGKAEYWWNADQLSSVEHYSNGKKHGLEQEYYKNGQLKRERHWQQGKPTDTTKEFFEDGQQKQVTVYAAPDVEQSTKRWREDGQLAYQEERLDSPHGPAKKKTIYRSKTVSYEWRGLETRWQKTERYTLDDKQLIYLEQYLDGRREGRFYDRTDSWGHLQKNAYIERHYHQGKLEGAYREVDDKGNVVEDGRYVQDKRIGPWIIQDYSGIRYHVTFDAKGQKHGKEAMEDDASGITGVAYYDHGVRTGEYHQTATDGTVITRGHYRNGKRDGQWLSREDCASMAYNCQGEYHNGMKVGTWNNFNKDHYLAAVEHYNDKGEKVGKHYAFMEDGQLFSISRYKDGELLSYQIADSHGEFHDEE